MPLPTTFQGLIAEAQQSHLYPKLVKQLNKDFLLANIDLGFRDDILPSSLKPLLHDIVYKLIQEQFTDYLNLLYIVDVSENEVRNLDGYDTVKLAEAVSFLILKREWQKVWYRNKF